MKDQNDIYTLTVKRLHRTGAKDPTAQIVALAKEVEQGRTKIRALEEELDKYRVTNRLLERDIEDWRKLAESKAEEIYPEFMRDYQCMQEELDGLYEELQELRKERDELREKSEKKTGEWVHGEYYTAHCSACGHEVKEYNITPYCPICGAQLDEEEVPPDAT